MKRSLASILMTILATAEFPQNQISCIRYTPLHSVGFIGVVTSQFSNFSQVSLLNFYWLSLAFERGKLNSSTHIPFLFFARWLGTCWVSPNFFLYCIPMVNQVRNLALLCQKILKNHLPNDSTLLFVSLFPIQSPPMYVPLTVSVSRRVSSIFFQ